MWKWLEDHPLTVVGHASAVIGFGLGVFAGSVDGVPFVVAGYIVGVMLAVLFDRARR